MHHYLQVLPLVAAALAVPLDQRAAAASVTIQHGTVVGSTASGVDSFKGIPYAQPPTGNLRLKPPQALTSSFGTLDAARIPKACPQFFSQVNTTNIPSDVLGTLLNTPIAQAATDTSEDCLTVNVQRPSGTTSSSKLPVVFWIFGGGFEFGSTQTYDATSLVSRSVALDEPVIYVAVNYRVNGFGFLAGKELAADGSTNLGLRDQRLGLQWVADNIAAFGGDPEKVTIWGESAGAISVYDQTIINGGDNTYKGKPLFRAGIMNSGSLSAADPVTAPQAQAVYDTVVANAGCSSASDTLACLRSKDYTTFLNAVTSVPAISGYRSVDLAYLPRPDPNDNFFPQSPEIPLAAGKFAKVPVIIGDQQDEGTLFALPQANITTNAELIQYLASYFPGDPNAVADVTGLVANYPDQPLLGQPAGSPFNTGGLYNIYPQFKRLAAILGDFTFTLTRRSYLSVVSSQVPAWSYLATYFQGTPVLGTFHASDILYDYGTLGPLAFPTITIQTYYINFINNLDPNKGADAAGQINWPNWVTGSKQLVDFGALKNTLITDDFRQAAYEYLVSKTGILRI